MKCVVCGLDNDPSAEFCAGCDFQLRENSGTTSSLAAGNGPAVESRPVEPRARPRRRPPLLVGVAVLLIAAVAGAVGWTMRGDDEPGAAPAPTSVTQPPPPFDEGEGDIAPSPDPAAVMLAQGQELDGLLEASKLSRDKLVNANRDVLDCAAMAGAVQRLREVGTERDSQRAKLADLDLSAIPQGEEIRAALDEALDHSLRADQHYVEWAETRQRNGCRNTSAARGHQEQGDQVSQQAGTAKTRFLSLWNPVATDLNLPARDRQEI